MDNKDEATATDKSAESTQATTSEQTQTSATSTPARITSNSTSPNEELTASTTVNQETTEPASQITANQKTSNRETQTLMPNQDDSNQPSSKKYSTSGRSTIQFNEKASHVSPTPSEDEPELDADILEDVLFYIGDMGLYQKLMFIGMLPFTTFYVWVYVVQIFITVSPSKYWCRVTELNGLTMELRRNLSAPGAATGEWDSCNTFDTDWNQVLKTLKLPPPETPKIPCPNGWEFEFTDIPYETVVSERGWVCNRAAYVPAAQSLFFVGALTGGLFFGWMADYLGRIPAIVGSNLIGGIGGITTTFTSGVWDFIFCRFLVGMAFDSCFMIAYILILEYVGPGHRTWVANMPIAIFGGAAGVVIPWIAYFVSDWRLLLWITSAPMFAAIVSPWLMPESVRWLVSRGRVDDALKVLRKFEKVNKSHVPEDVMKTFIETSKKMGSKKAKSLAAVFRSMLLRVTLIYMVIVYSSNAVIYDTLVRITQQFGLDFFITFTINWAIEIPSILVLIVLLDRLGRRILTGGSLLIGGGFLFVAMFVPRGIPRVIFGIVARFLINLSFAVLCQWGTEILPTPFRASGSAALHMTGFITSLLSPFIVHSEVVWSSLPLLIVSIWSVLSAILCVLLPETKGQEMPQTVADAEKIIQNQSICRQPEMVEFKKAVSKVMSHTISDTIHRNPEGRVSHLRLH